MVEEAAVTRPSRDGHPRFSYEQPTRRRSFLDGGVPRRNPVLRPHGSAHISLTARR